MGDSCSSLECLAKTIGWLHVITGSMLVLYHFVLLATTIATDVEPYNQIIIAESDNITLVKVNEETIAMHKEKVAAKTIDIIFGIIIIILNFITIGLAGVLLTGIRKKKPKLVWVWLVANGICCCLVAGFILIEIGSMLLATDPGSLTKQIIWLVLNILQLWVVHAYYEESKDQVLPAY